MTVVGFDRDSDTVIRSVERHVLGSDGDVCL